MKKLSLLLILALAVYPASCNVFCSLCYGLYDIAHAIFNSDLYIGIMRAASLKSCGGDPVTCAQYFDNNDVTSVINYINRLDPTITCPKLGLCSSPKIVPDDIEKLRKELLRDKPPRKYEPVRNSSQHFQFAVITDVHIEPNYTQSKSTECNSSCCCRDTSPDVKGPKDRPGKWGHVGKCDLPMRTLDNAVDDIWKNHKDVKFVLWLGDNQANVYFLMQREDHRRIAMNMSRKLREHFNGLGSVYPVIGNHEGLPRDHMDFTPNTSNWLRDIVTEAWTPWLTAESVVTLKKCGYYSQIHPGTKLRIIGLNALAHGATNSYIWANTTNICGQFTWLKDLLYAAERNGEKVMILDHYPPRTGFGINQWSERQSILMERFANIIVGFMAGHTHMDSFQIFTTAKPGEYAGVALEHPSMTSSYSRLPSYRIYDMDPSNYALIDYEQYRLNLTKANADDNPVWELSYRFKEYYGVPNLEDRTFATLAEKIRTQDAYYKKFAWMQYSEGPYSIQAVKDVSRKKSTYCGLTCTDYGRMEKCVGGYSFWTLFQLRHFLPPWEYAVNQVWR